MKPYATKSKAPDGLGDSRGAHRGRAEHPRRRREPPPRAAPSTASEGDAPQENGPGPRRARSPRAWPAAPPASASAGPPAPRPPWRDRPGRTATSPLRPTPRALPRPSGARAALSTAQAPRHHQSSPEPWGPTQPGRLRRPDSAIVGGRRGAGPPAEPGLRGSFSRAPLPSRDGARNLRRPPGQGPAAGEIR